MIHYHDESQRKIAMRLKVVYEARIRASIFTEVVPYRGLYLAEDYHQKYYLKSVPDITEEYLAIYGDPKELTESTAAARANGYIGRYGTMEQLERDIDSLGLSAEGRKKLLQVLGSRGTL